MFDGIQFENILLRKPLRDLEGVVGGDVRSSRDDLTSYYQSSQRDMEYLLEGSAKVVYPMPISSFARENLLYMQVFSIYDAGSMMYTKRVHFPYYLLLYTYEGSGILKYEGNSYTLAPGDGFIIDCRKEHTYRTAADHWMHALLHYAGHTSGWLYQQFSMRKSPVFHLEHPGKLQENLERLMTVYQRTDPYREYKVSMHLQKLLLELIQETSEDVQNVPDYIRYLERYLQSNYQNRMTVDEISRFAGVSKYHLEREFKKYTGHSITDYLIDVRLSHACFLLSSTNLPVNEICQDSGFADYPGFLKLFKSRLKVTPRQYRQR